MLDSIGYVYQLDAQNITFKISSAQIDPTKARYFYLPTNDTITVMFRYWKPGEI